MPDAEELKAEKVRSSFRQLRYGPALMPQLEDLIRDATGNSKLNDDRFTTLAELASLFGVDKGHICRCLKKAGVEPHRLREYGKRTACYFRKESMQALGRRMKSAG